MLTLKVVSLATILELQYNFVYPTIVGPDDYTRLYLCSDIPIDHFNVFLIFVFYCHFVIYAVGDGGKRTGQCESEKNGRY